MIVIQALVTSNEHFRVQTALHESQTLNSNTTRILPMINEKKTSEVIETSLIYLLSAAVAVGAFVLVWLISLLLGFGQA